MPDVLKIIVQLLLLAAPFVVLFLLLRWAKPRGKWYQAGTAVALGVCFFLAWVNLAVGIIGEPDNIDNLLYMGLVPLMLSLSLLVRFEPVGMSHVMLLMVMAQVSVTVYVLLMGIHLPHQTPARAIIALTVIMSVFWLLSSWLFSKSQTAHSDK